MKKIHSLVVASTLLFAGQAQAATAIDPAIITKTQAVFNNLSDDLAAVTWMNPSNSAESHSSGIIPVGIQAAVEVTELSINPADQHWQDMGVTVDTIPVPRLRVSAGIPFGLDVGVMYLASADLDINLTGVEVRMAFGNYIPVPMLEANVRYHQSTLTAGSDMEIENKGYAVMVGANLPIFKPYIEVGSVTATSTPSGLLTSGPVVLTAYETTETTLAIGAKIELALFIINLEKSTVGDRDLITAKLGFEF